MTEHHEWRLYDDGSGAFCINREHHDKACMMSREEIEACLNATGRLSAEHEKLILLVGVLLDKIAVFTDHKRGCTWDDGTKGDVCTCGFRPLISEIYKAQDAYAGILEE